eukprot:c17791_g1_i1 orf=331-1776(-)
MFDSSPESPQSIYNMMTILILLVLCILPNSSSSFALGLASSKCPSELTTENIVGWGNVRSTGTHINNTRDGGDEAVLKVVIPWKVGFEDFVKFNNNTCMLDGFSVQVFRNVLNNMGSSAPSIRIILYGDGKTTPSYDEMVDMVYDGKVDAIVADLTITKTRMQKVAFTLPYTHAALVMVTLSRYRSEGKPWDFLKPFSPELWETLMLIFAVTGPVLWVLESFNANVVLNKHNNVVAERSRNNMHTEQVTPTTDPSSFQELTGQAFSKRSLMNAYWFTSLCVFGVQQEPVRTHFGRVVTVSWMLVMLIMFNASYTASLVSLLSQQTRIPTVEEVQALLKNENISVGYQEGSFMRSFLANFTRSTGNRLQAYNSTKQFQQGLRLGSEKGGVDAIIDELPIVEPLLKTCMFIKTSDYDPLPSFGGYGFAFAKNSTLTNKVSMEILALIENKTIKQLQNNFKIGNGESVEDNEDCNSPHLKLTSF